MYDPSMTGSPEVVRARRAFHGARRRAALRSIWARLRGRPTRLCAIQEALRRGGPWVHGPRALDDVPLARVVGSEGRAHDYTGAFLPRVAGDEERWARVRLAIEEGDGVPPLELYELDDLYYVRDGHHRVSVLRRLGVKRFEAYVTPLRRSGADPSGPIRNPQSSSSPLPSVSSSPCASVSRSASASRASGCNGR